MKKLLIPLTALVVSGCATLTEDAMTPIAMSFSDGSNGQCELSNKRGLWNTDVPAIVSVRKSDDALKYRCKTGDGREVSGAISSEMGGKIIASAVFLDFGITDAITDKHRKYAESYVVPIRSVNGTAPAAVASTAGPTAADTAAAPAAAAPAAAAAVEAPVPVPAPTATSGAATGESSAPIVAQHQSAATTLATSEGCQAPKLLRAAGDAETYQADCDGTQFKLISCTASGCHVMR